MKISDVLKTKLTASFEVFPPKKEDAPDLKPMYATIARLSASRPDFISVTYQPIGRNSERALEIADFIRSSGMTAMSHLTAVGYLKEDVDAFLADLKRLGIENVLALRGDIPSGLEFPTAPWRDFKYAENLITHIRLNSALCIGAACNPEGHPECPDPELGIDFLKRKRDAGADFFVTQLFFDVEVFFRFVERVRARGIGLPIVAGVMPVLRSRQIRKIISLSACSVPPELATLLDRYADDKEGMSEAGIEFAARQVERLVKGGVDGVHIYTMNKPVEAAEVLKRGLSSSA